MAVAASVWSALVKKEYLYNSRVREFTRNIHGLARKDRRRSSSGLRPRGTPRKRHRKRQWGRRL